MKHLEVVIVIMLRTLILDDVNLGDISWMD